MTGLSNKVNTNAGSTLANRSRRRPNIDPVLSERAVCSDDAMRGQNAYALFFGFAGQYIDSSNLFRLSI